MEERLEFESKKGKAVLYPLGFEDDFRWYQYCLYIDDGQGVGELSFNQYGGIVNCKYFSEQKVKTMELSKFKERFREIILKIVPEKIYAKYLSALDMGKEGIFPEADNKKDLKKMFGNKNLIFSYLFR